MKAMACCLSIEPGVKVDIDNVHLPARKVLIQRDPMFSLLKDYEMDYLGGQAVRLTIEQKGSFPTMFYLGGEVNVNASEVSFIKLQFRKGNSKFNWPDYTAVMQCPVCRKVATGNPTTLAVLAYQPQLLMSAPSETNQPLGMRLCPRVFCHGCFTVLVDGLTMPCRNADTGEPADINVFPRLLRHNVMQRKLPSGLHERVNELAESGWFTSTSDSFMQTIMEKMGSRVSKSATQKNGGQLVSRPIKLQKFSGCMKPECGVRSGPGIKLNRCSACKKAYYCSKEHQVGDWKRHKVDCKEWRKVEEVEEPFLVDPVD